MGDEGLAALVAPPPPAGAPPTTTGVLTKLKLLSLRSTKITDAGCADLTAALEDIALYDNHPCQRRGEGRRGEQGVICLPGARTG